MIGAVYVITHDPRYTGLLLSSVASLKRVMPELPVTVFSEFPVESPYFERVIRVKSSNYGFYDKAQLLRQTPYERTVFIDADIYVIDPVHELFALLDRFDCAAAHEEYLNTDWWHQYPRPDIPASFPEFNTGIVAYKSSPRMDGMLQAWATLYESFIAENPGKNVNDQPFFRAAVYFSDIRMAVLTREYNCKFRGQGYLKDHIRCESMGPSRSWAIKKEMNYSAWMNSRSD